MLLNSYKFLLLLALCPFLFTNCGDDDEMPGTGDDSLTHIPYDPTPFGLQIPPGFPPMFIPPDNPMTEEGIQLGRHLFFDPILSADSTMGCFSCHLPEGSFTDNKAVSLGIKGLPGKRSSMGLLNVGFFEIGKFWDGRAATLEDQALGPVEDALELADTWENVEMKLRRHSTYPKMFREAFGIDSKQEITRQLAVKAIAQFERTMIAGDTKYHKVQRGEAFFTDDELAGHQHYFEENGVTSAQCFHCHGAPLMANDKEYFNNALDEVDFLNDFPDPGRGMVTQDSFDNGRFRAPSLINIVLTAPYMHDGRFNTLEEVMDHYVSGGHPSPNRASEMDELRDSMLTQIEKQQVLAFLEALTDTTYLSNPLYKSPF